ncbi:hypothetical protein [Nocardioides limicola]|uniref:hypothetical protein n=1 Tax=Nocardioides limicola TaxID=2803368 RepID=UPI00193C85FA|nr:hypothetical protein [Nocardioides sp. DJM-14]
MSENAGGTDRLSKVEIRKDAAQSVLEAGIGTVGEVAGILTGAVKDVVGAVGDLATEVFEISDAARRAGQDHEVEPTRAADDA